MLLEIRRENKMNDNIIPLNYLPLGRKGRVKSLTSIGMTRRRMLEIEALQKSPSGDPVAYYIRGAVIALRSEEASKILVEEIK